MLIELLLIFADQTRAKGYIDDIRTNRTISANDTNRTIYATCPPRE